MIYIWTFFVNWSIRKMKMCQTLSGASLPSPLHNEYWYLQSPLPFMQGNQFGKSQYVSRTSGPRIYVKCSRYWIVWFLVSISFSISACRWSHLFSFPLPHVPFLKNNIINICERKSTIWVEWRDWQNFLWKFLMNLFDQ